jgi:hypothetical protein
MKKHKEKRAALLLHSTVLASYALLSLLLTWPLVLHLSSALPAVRNELGVDVFQNVWNMWWTRQALVDLSNPYWTPVLIYPQGASLTLHTLNLPLGLLAAPLLPLIFEMVKGLPSGQISLMRTVPASVPSLRHNSVSSFPLEKKRVLPPAVICEINPEPEEKLLMILVPASVPSLFHKSPAPKPRLVMKKRALLTTVESSSGAI